MMKKDVLYVVRILSLFTAFVTSQYVYTQTNLVTEIITDFPNGSNNYWISGTGNINPVLPNNSHNLLAFTYNGVRYSTGVNNTILNTIVPAIAYTPRTYKAIAVSSLPGTLTTNTKMGLGALYDGVNNGASNPAPSAALSYYLMDGPQGLDLGTGIANLPVGTLRFDVSGLQISNVGDGVPDILVTQFASIANVYDRFSFRNAANQIVGTEIVINLSTLLTLGNWTADFYETTPTRNLQATFRQTNRPLRIWAADLSQFGLNSGNIASVTSFQITLSGESDQAFVAYNASALALVPDELPGGVSKQPSLWLKANNGPSTMTNGETVSDWADKSGKANNASQSIGSLKPIYRTNGTNFNQTVYFGAHSLNTFQNLSSGNGLAYTTFVVMKPINTSVAKVILGSTGTAATNSVRQTLTATNVPNVIHDPSSNVFPNSPPTFGNITRIWSTLYTGTNNRLWLDMVNSQTSNQSFTYTNRPTLIGSHRQSTPTGEAEISEIITYPMALDDNEIQRINSYLAIKYGITLSVNYLSCSNNLLFQSDGVGTTYLYDNRVFGIGRENCQLLNQKQSKSIVSGTMVTIGAGDTITTENTSNTTLLTNGSYLMMGDNNEAITWNSGAVSGPVHVRIGRTWRATVTGTPGSVKIRIPADNSSESSKLEPLPPFAVPFMLVKASDDNFNSGYTTVPLTLVGTNYETNYNFQSSNQFYTFGYTIVNPLPVELLNFEAIASQENKKVQLVWETTSEINNDYFHIEQSTDGINWKLVGRKDGAGNSNSILRYELTDPNPAEGLSYYRLKQFDYDGTETLEGIRSVYFDAKFSLEIFPNPAKEKVNIRAEQIDKIEVYDVSGQLYQVPQKQNSNLWTIDTQPFAAGVYYFKITSGSKTRVEKVVISK